MAVINLLNSFKTSGQFPLDNKLYFKTLAEITDLGISSFKAFSYYEDMIIQSIEDHKQYIWREVTVNDEEGDGLLESNFIYPDGVVSNGLTYSNKVFNFFLYSNESEGNGGGLFEVVNTGSISTTINTNSLYSGDYTVISGGLDNQISNSDYSTLSGGRGNTMVGNIGGVISGGYDNTLSQTDYSVIAGGESNKITNAKWALVAGLKNEATIDYETIFGRYATVSNSYGDRIFAIGNGTGSGYYGVERKNALQLFDTGVMTLDSVTNTLIDNASGKAVVTKEWFNANNSGGGGGVFQTDGNNNVFVTINSSSITNSVNSTLSGGYINSIENSSALSSIGGGNNNTINSSTSSVISGGSSNDIIDAQTSGIGSGEDNTISGTYSNESSYNFIGGGRFNAISGSKWSSTGSGYYVSITNSQYSTASGYYCEITNARASNAIGEYNTILNSDFASVVGGDSNQINNSNYAVLGGRNNSSIDAASSVVFGIGNSAANQGETVLGITAVKDTTGKRLLGVGNTGSDAFNLYNDGIATLPSVTNTLIDSASDKAIVTKEWVNANAGGGGGAGVYIRATNSASVYDSIQPANDTNQNGDPVVSGNYSAVMSGLNVFMTGSNYAFMGAGYDNALTFSQNSVLVGGKGNTISAGYEDNRYSVIVGGTGNTVSGYESGVSIIGGGENNTIDQDTDYGAILGGKDNSVRRASGSSIVGGNGNTVSDYYCFVGGGGGNTASGYYSSVVGGTGNTASGQYSSVLNGYRNIASGNYSTVLSGKDNSASGYYSVVVGGLRNSTISTESDTYACSILNGRDNTVSGYYSTIVGGANNTVSGYYSVVLGGQGNTAETLSEVVGGQYSTLKEPSNSIAFVPTDRLFTLGNGTSNSSRSDALTVFKNGLATLDSVDNTLIDNASGKAIVTKEWVNANSGGGGFEGNQSISEVRFATLRISDLPNNFPIAEESALELVPAEIGKIIVPTKLYIDNLLSYSQTPPNFNLTVAYFGDGQFDEDIASIPLTSTSQALQIVDLTDTVGLQNNPITLSNFSIKVGQRGIDGQGASFSGIVGNIDLTIEYRVYTPAQGINIP